jgi:hypothetical protein
MTLLDFARGPGLQWSLIILIAGVLWRLGGTILLNARKDLSRPRHKSTLTDGLKVIATRSLPAHQFEKRIRFQHFSGYAWHLRDRRRHPDCAADPPRLAPGTTIDFQR